MAEPVSDSTVLFVRPDEAARRLGIGRTRVYEELRSGRLRSFMHGRRTRLISISALTEYADALERDATNDARIAADA